MNPLDLVAILLVVVGALLGFRSGALPQIGGLVGAIGGAALVIVGLPFLADQLEKVEPSFRPFVVLAGLLIAVALGESIGSTIGRRVATAPRDRGPRCGGPDLRRLRRGRAGGR